MFTVEQMILADIDTTMFSKFMTRICSDSSLNIHTNRFDKGTLAEEAVVLSSKGKIASLNTESTSIGKDLVHLSSGKTLEAKITNITTAVNKVIKKVVTIKINNSMKKDCKIQTCCFDCLIAFDTVGLFVLAKDKIESFFDESKDGVIANIPSELIENVFVRFPQAKSYREVKAEMMRKWLMNE